MDIVTRQTLQDVLSEILEQFAFVFAETEPAPVDSPREDVPLLTWIGFIGQRRSGRLTLAASQDLGAEVARNVLGEDDEGSLPRDANRNALQEVVNIACGNLLARLYGTEEMFELSVPECREISPEEWNNMAREEGMISMSAEEEPLLVLLEVEEG